MNPFIFVKPEGLICCPRTIERFISNEGLEIQNKLILNPWERVAEDIYSEPAKIRGNYNELLAWLKTIREFFPERYNMGEYIEFREEGDLIEKIGRLNMLKRKLRKEVQPSQITTLYNGEFGEWKIFFTYLHVPDPNPEIIRKEFEIAKKYSGELDNDKTYFI